MLIARLPAARVALLGLSLSLGLAGLVAAPLRALEKEGMPDLAQEEETCLPTSTANIIVYFGLHGYPKLIQPGDSKDDGYIHTVHRIMDATDASYQLGTRTEAITYGIAKYIHDAGYGCDVEYRGLDWSQAKFPHVVDDKLEDKYKAFQKTPVPFTADWLQGNNDTNKAFLLLLAYVNFEQGTNTFHDALNAGHAVTLVNAEPDMILIHDPAHYGDEPGRKILTPEILTGGTFHLPGYAAPVSGLMLLSGTLMEPEDCLKMLTGAVCVTMHPVNDTSTIIASSAGAPNSVISGQKGGTPTPAPTAAKPIPAAATPATTSWGLWLFNLLLGK